MHKILWRVGTLACAFLMACPPQAAADNLCANVAGNLVLNCGFESGLLDWSGTGDFGTSDRSQSGSFAAYLAHTALSEGTLSQSVATEAGRTYDLQFWVLGDILWDPFEARWNGAPVFATSLTPDVLNVYRLIQVAVTGTGADTLSFFGAETDPGRDTWYLDDVSLVARQTESVPEPSTVLLLGAGLAAAFVVSAHSTTRRVPRKCDLPAPFLPVDHAS